MEIPEDGTESRRIAQEYEPNGPERPTEQTGAGNAGAPRPAGHRAFRRLRSHSCRRSRRLHVPAGLRTPRRQQVDPARRLLRLLRTHIALCQLSAGAPEDAAPTQAAAAGRSRTEHRLEAPGECGLAWLDAQCQPVLGPPDHGVPPRQDHAEDAVARAAQGEGYKRNCVRHDERFERYREGHVTTAASYRLDLSLLPT